MIPRLLKTFLSYLRTPAARSVKEFDNAIEEEIAFHIEARTREFVENGMSEEDARRAAHQRFGDRSRVAADCHAAAIGGLILWHRLHLGVTAVLVVAVGTLWYASSRALEERQMLASRVPPGIASMLDNDWTGDVSGQILDEHRQPIEGAHVLVVVKTWPDQSYFQRAYAAVSDSAGMFLVQDVRPVDERFEVQIAVVMKGRVLKSSYFRAPGGVLEPVVLQLQPSSSLALQIQTEQGIKLTDIEVMPHGRIETGGVEHIVYFDSAQSVVSRTDIDGRVELPYFLPGDTANVLIHTSEGGWESRMVVVPTAGEVVTIRVSRRPERRSKES